MRYIDPEKVLAVDNMEVAVGLVEVFVVANIIDFRKTDKTERHVLLGIDT